MIYCIGSRCRRVAVLNRKVSTNHNRHYAVRDQLQWTKSAAIPTMAPGNQNPTKHIEIIYCIL